MIISFTGIKGDNLYVNPLHIVSIVKGKSGNPPHIHVIISLVNGEFFDTLMRPEKFMQILEIWSSTIPFDRNWSQENGYPMSDNT